ncbi:MFS transporter [Streptomyces sp. NPDC052042]|uniref:MFS transporter n=1 Tax=Streptomyces sp. NPDC052042 TaxID=3365683 RepID=UPI0037D333A3
MTEAPAALHTREKGELPERLWSRDFTLLFVARTISVLGDQMLIPTTITVAVLQAGHGITGVGYALAAHGAPLALFVVLGGVLVDRFTPIRVMVAADIARLIFQGGLAAAFIVGTPDLWLIVTLLALGGTATAAFQPGYVSVIPRTARDIQKANAAIRVTESLMTVLGPALAGVLIAVSSVSLVLVLDATTFAVSCVCLLAMRLRISRPGRRSSVRSDLVQGWREFSSRSWLWGVIVIFMLFQATVNGPFLALGQSLVTLEHGEGTLGFVMAMFGAGSALGGLVAARLRPAHPLRAGALALTGTVFCLLTVALQLSVPVIAASYVVWGAGAAFWLVMFHTAVQTKIPPDVLARVHAYDVAGSVIMRPAGQMAAGPAAIWLGVAPVLFFSSSMVLVTVGLLLAVPAIRNLRRE